MGRTVWKIVKVVIMFIVCLTLFFYGLRLMHNEYEQYHRYDLPEGPAVKVYQQSEQSLLRHFYSFFR